VAARFEAYGWHVQTVATGDSADVSALRDAVSAAQGATDRPSLIKVQTTIGYGAAKQGTHDVHGAPIGAADPASSFYVDPEVAAVFAECRAVGKKSHAAWSAMFARCDPSTLLALTALSLTLSVVLCFESPFRCALRTSEIFDRHKSAHTHTRTHAHMHTRMLSLMYTSSHSLTRWHAGSLT
jgi:transketolase